MHDLFSSELNPSGEFIGSTNGIALAINEAGVVVGQLDHHAFVWDPLHGIRQLPTLGGSSSVASGINDLGQIVGSSTLPNGISHAVLWTVPDLPLTPTIEDLTPALESASSALAINNAGTIVGTATSPSGIGSRAARWHGATRELTFLDIPGVSSAAHAINESGMTAGYFEDGYGFTTADREQKGFVWAESGSWVTVGSLGGVVTAAADINDDGFVVGSSSGQAGHHAFLLENAWAAPLSPALTLLTPASATSGGDGDLALALSGERFEPNAIVLWNGQPLTPDPVMSSSTLLNVLVPRTLLHATNDLVTVVLRVRDPDNQLSGPALFTIVGNGNSAAIVDVTTGSPGETVQASIPPASDEQSGVTATLTVSGVTPVTVTAAVYDSQPVSVENVSFDVAGSFLDLNVVGASAQDSMEAVFYYPASADPGSIVLRFFNPSTGQWQEVSPVQHDAANRRFIVTFNSSSAPAITQLTGTIFVAAVQPQSLVTFAGFLPPIGGADETGGSFERPLQTFKAHSTIPVRFTASLDGTPLITGQHTLRAIKFSDSTTAGMPVDATPQGAATSGNQFQLLNSQWQFNLDTKATGLSVGIWKLIARLSDGSEHGVWIQIK